MTTTYSALLAAARKRVHSPYSGPTPGELAAKVVLEYLSTNQAEPFQLLEYQMVRVVGQI